MRLTTYKKILEYGIYTALVPLFLVFNSLLFPYITSKQIPFNILIEILTVFWVGLIVKYPEARPRFSWITVSLGMFFAIAVLTCFTGVDFNLSFWGDVERMLGMFHVLHFYLFYLIIVTVFKEKEDQMRFLKVFLIASSALAFYGVLQRFGAVHSPWGPGRIISTLGNSAYVGTFSIFSIFFAILAFVKTKLKQWRIFFVVVAGLNLLALIFSQTRGAYIGLAAGLVCALLLAVFLSQNKKMKIGAVGILIFGSLFVASLFANKQSQFVRGYSFLSTITNISLDSTTFNTRFLAWKWAIQGLADYPLLGPGWGNFALIYDRYFDPVFYDFVSGGEYFDRAHNNFIEVLSTTGLIGFSFYALVFVFSALYLIKLYRARAISMGEFIILFSLLTAYSVNNIVIFDSFSSYIAVMIFLALVHSMTATLDEKMQFKFSTKWKINERDALFVFSVIAVLVIYSVNLKPLMMLKGVIDGQVAFAQGNYLQAINLSREALSHNTVLDRDGRNAVTSAITSRNTAVIAGLSKDTAYETIDWTVDLARLNVEYNPQDALMQMQYAQALNWAASFYKESDKQKYADLLGASNKAMDQSLKSSPGQIRHYFVKAQIYLNAGNIDGAEQVLRYAIGLNENYGGGYCQLGRLFVLLEKTEEGYANIDKCLEKGDLTYIAQAYFLQKVIEHYESAPAIEVEKLILLYETLTRIKNNDAQMFVNLAKYYKEVGEIEKARSVAMQAARINPALESAVRNFVNGLVE